MAQSDTLNRADVDLEAMWDKSIPCDLCSQPAKLRSFGHMVNDCQPGTVYHKCFKHYAVWLADIYSAGGSWTCDTCGRLFTEPDIFSNYREF